jgi:hypothetical protein
MMAQAFDDLAFRRLLIERKGYLRIEQEKGSRTSPGIVANA